MRLSALGTAAVGLLVVVVLTAGVMVVSFTLAMPAMGRMARPFALEQVAAIDTSISALEQTLAKEDWKALPEHADQASSALHRLAHGPALTSLTARTEPPTADELRARLKAVHDHLRAAHQALAAKEAERVDAALAKFFARNSSRCAKPPGGAGAVTGVKEHRIPINRTGLRVIPY
jgi:hypothetical protein